MTHWAIMPLLDCGIATSEQLVQAFKRESDPVRRLEVLRTAWDDRVVFVPQKAFLLADSILEALRKDNGSALQGYWALLAALVATGDMVYTLVMRHSVLSLAAPLLSTADAAIWGAAAPALTVLAPLAVRRAGIEGTNDMLITFIGAVPRICNAATVYATLAFLDAVMRAWVPAISLGQNAKKTARAFERAVRSYATSRVHAESLNAPQLVDALDVLLARAIFSPGTPLAECTQALAAQVVPAAGDSDVVRAAPALVALALRASSPNWTDSPQTSALNHVQVRHVLLTTFLVPVLDTLASPAAPEARMHIARLIEAHGLYILGGEDDDTWRELLATMRTDTLASLSTHRDVSFHTLIALWLVHADSFQGQLVDAVTAAAEQYTEAGVMFVRSVIERFASARSMPTLFGVLRNACDALAARHGEEAPRMLARGSLFSDGTLFLEDAIYIYTPAPQAASLLIAAVDGTERDGPAFTCAAFLLLLIVRNVDVEDTSVIARVDALAKAAIGDGHIAAGLRLIYGLRHARHDVNVDSVPRTSATPPPLVPLIKSSSPETIVESLRAALDHRVDVEDAIAAAIPHITHCDAQWNGNVLGLDAACLPAALWRLITTRWTHVLDDYPIVLPNLIALLQDTLEFAGPLSELSRQMLRNPAFHEMANWRKALLAHVGSALEWIDPTAPCTATHDTRRALARAATLSYVPPEYIDSSLITRLIWLDGHLAVHGGDTQQWSMVHHVLRRALAQDLHIDAYISGARTNPALLERADDLVESASALIERAKWTLDTAGRRRALETAEALPTGSAGELILYAIVAVSAERATDSPIMSSSVLDAFRSDAWMRLPAIGLTVRAFSAELHYAKADGEVVLQLASAIERVGRVSEAHAELTAALFSGIEALQRADARHTNVLCAAYALADASLGSEAVQGQLAPVFVAAVARMDEATYSKTLDTLARAVTTSRDPSLLSTLGVVLQHGPPGTSRTARRCFYALLVQLPDALSADARLIPATAVVIERVCTSRALLLRAADVPRILGVMGVMLGPRADKADIPTSAVFCSLVATLSALVRLRKDLVGAYLPHLGQILCELLALLVSVSQRHAGGAALRELRESTPVWSDPARAPLGVRDAQALGRLLSELPAKSTPLVAAAVAQKRRKLDGGAQTLAGAMSKHAIYVLLAYVRCVTRTATTITQPLRHELYPGLMALCGMISPHERDAALKGLLDAAGQLVFKSIWNDWERQRYRGS